MYSSGVQDLGDTQESGLQKDTVQGDQKFKVSIVNPSVVASKISCESTVLYIKNNYIIIIAHPVA